MSAGPLLGATGNSVIWPEGVIRPTLSRPSSVNQMLPSLPAATPQGPGRVGPLKGIGNAFTSPSGVMRPMASAFWRANQTLPSGPATIP